MKNIAQPAGAPTVEALKKAMATAERNAQKARRNFEAKLAAYEDGVKKLSDKLGIAELLAAAKVARFQYKMRRVEYKLAKLKWKTAKKSAVKPEKPLTPPS